MGLESRWVLLEAYGKLFKNKQRPQPTMNNWQIAAMVMEGFDPKVLGEDLAKKCIFVVCNHLGRPILDNERDTVEQALHNAREHFWPQLTFEDLACQMSELERLEMSLA
jgi:hypothetical protein